MSIDGIGARTGATYSDMRLVDARTIPDGESYLVQFTYETIGSSFVQVKDDTISFTESGLRRVQRESIAAAGTAFSQTVGTTTIDHQINAETAVACRLAAYEINDTDSSRTVIATYVEEGTLSRTEDFVGSQKAIVIEAIGPDPSTPSDYSPASKEESNFEGLQTNRFTFLKDNVVLSESEDKVGAQKAIVKEVFNGTPATPDGYSIASEESSNVAAIATKRFTFLKNGAVLSSTTEERQSGSNSTGKVRIQTVEVFNGTPASTIGGVKISEQKSNVGAIVTTRAVFATGSGEVSRSTETRNNGKLTVTTVEALGTAGTGTGTEIEATTREENGFTVFRNVFAEGVGEVSRTTETKNNGKLTVTTVESLGSAGSAAGVEIESTTREENGFTLFRNTFADGTGEISRTTETRNNGKLTVTTVEALGSAGSATGAEIESTTREQDGYTLFRNVFAEGSGEVSRTTETRNNGKLTITTVESLGTKVDAPGDVELESTERQENGFVLFRSVKASGAGEISRTVETRNKGALTITTVESLGSAGSAGSASGVEIEATTREENGFTLFRNVFADGSGEISKTTTGADAFLPLGCKEVTEVHVAEPIPEQPPNNGRLIRESVQQQDGFDLHTRTYLEGNLTGTTTEYEDYVEVEIPGEVTLETETVSSGGDSGEIAIVKVQPKRIERKKANIKIEIIKVEQGGQIPSIGDIAYDLGKISCSVTATNIQRSIGPGSTVTIGAGTNNINSDTGFVADFKVQTSVTNYPGHFITGEKTKEGKINYISSSQPVASGNVITRQEETVDRITKLVGTGSDESDKSSSWKESGVISRRIRPVLADLKEGAPAKYYEVITTTIGTSGS